MADFTRSSTLASTAILRGFVENTYLTNYSPKLADPNVVDFSALQNMKPKQIIPTNGNPAAAVAALPPETISTGTVPLLRTSTNDQRTSNRNVKSCTGFKRYSTFLETLNRSFQLFNQLLKRESSIFGRRFAETGFKHLISGIYETMVKRA